MPKQKRREQHHLRQAPARRRSYTLGGTAQGEKYSPPFPMNLFQNVKLFFVIGAAIMIGGVVFAAVLQGRNPSHAQPVSTPVPTATSSATPDESATPGGTPTPGTKKFSAAEQAIDAGAKQYTATIKTDKGEIVIKLLADQAPRTVNSFVFLAQKGFFDGLTFHRVVKDFVVQSGDPTATGSGGPGYQTEEDKNDLKNIRGMISMAKAGAVTNFGSQFFVNLKDNPALDTDNPTQKRFYPFAQVVTGMDVVDKIAQGDVIRSVTISEQPKG